MKGLSEKWQKLVIWLTGYLNIIAFIVGVGYIHQKTESDDVKASAKTVLFLTLIFTLISLITGILTNVFSLAENYEVTAKITDVNQIVSIIKSVVFAVLFILDLCGIKLLPVKSKKSEEAAQPNEE